MGTNIEGGDRFLLGDRWLRFMGVIGMSNETVGNVFDGSGGLGGKPRKSIISGCKTSIIELIGFTVKLEHLSELIFSCARNRVKRNSENDVCVPSLMVRWQYRRSSFLHV